jgi:hypothetical protein
MNGGAGLRCRRRHGRLRAAGTPVHEIDVPYRPPDSLFVRCKRPFLASG